MMLPHFEAALGAEACFLTFFLLLSCRWVRRAALGRAKARGAGIRGRRGRRIVEMGVAAWRMQSEWRLTLRPGLKSLICSARQDALARGFEGLLMGRVGGERGEGLRSKIISGGAFAGWVNVVNGGGCQAEQLAEKVIAGNALRCWVSMRRHWATVKAKARRHARAWGHIRCLIAGGDALEAWRDLAKEEREREEGMVHLLEFHCHDTRVQRKVMSLALMAWRDGAFEQREAETAVAGPLALRYGTSFPAMRWQEHSFVHGRRCSSPSSASPVDALLQPAFTTCQESASYSLA
jgi:hypothetical protein